MKEKYINEIHRLYNSQAEKKIKKIENGIEKSIREYELENIEELDNLYSNYIIKAYSKKYEKEVIVKIILDDTQNSEEIEMLELYNGNHSVKVLAKEKDAGILVLEYIDGENLSKEQDKEKQAQILCELIDNLVIEKSDTDYTLIPEYKTLLKNAINKNEKIKKEKVEYSDEIERIDKLKLQIIGILNELENKIGEEYYLHGDLHTYNVMKSKNGYLAIDPHGVIGRKVFEYTQYILNEIWNDEEIYKKEEIKVTLESVIDRIVKYSSEEKEDIEKATIVHAYLTALWFIEDSGSKRAIDKNIKIIEVLLSKFDVIIRRVREEDIEQVVDLQITGWQNAYRGIIEDSILDNMDRNAKIEKRKKDYNQNGFIVAEKDSKIVGYSRYVDNNSFTKEVESFDCELLALYVDATLKGQGIGTKLFTFITNEFRQNGKKKMILWCLKDNIKSRKFYEKMGGKVVATRPFTIGQNIYDEVCYEYDI